MEIAALNLLAHALFKLGGFWISRCIGFIPLSQRFSTAAAALTGNGVGDMKVGAWANESPLLTRGVL
jgi:hypothetical protein